MGEKREKKESKKEDKPFFGSGSFLDAAAKRKKRLDEAAGKGYSKRGKKSNGKKA